MSRRDRLSPAEEWELPLNRGDRLALMAGGIFCGLVACCAVVGAYAIGMWCAGRGFGL